MARTGLRMMPTFPWSPLKFRTAGFPQYGLKAGISDEAFPQCGVCLRPSCGLLPLRFPALCQGQWVSTTPPCERYSALPQGSSLRPGYSVPALSAYLTPCAPLAGASRLHRLAVYTRCPRCAENDPRPRQPTSGSELSLMLCRNMSSSVTAGNSLAALAQLLRREHWPSTPKKRLGIPFILTLRSW